MKRKQSCRVAIVTGGNSGIGKETAMALAKAGYRVYEFSRRALAVEGVIHRSVDVTDEAQVQSAVCEIVDEMGRVDLLVCNAGFGISGAVECTDAVSAHRQMEVNLFGADYCVRAVLPQMRKQKRGRILCVSSIAGILPIPYQTWYSVSKAALAAYVLGLQNEVRGFHISVCAVLPGDIATGFTEAREKSAKGDDIYKGKIGRSVARMEKDEQKGMRAAEAGHMIAQIAVKRRSKPVIALGFGYKAAAMAAKLLPRRLSNWIVWMIYGR